MSHLMQCYTSYILSSLQLIRLGIDIVDGTSKRAEYADSVFAIESVGPDCCKVTRVLKSDIEIPLNKTKELSKTQVVALQRFYSLSQADIHGRSISKKPELAAFKFTSSMYPQNNGKYLFIKTLR